MVPSHLEVHTQILMVHSKVITLFGDSLGSISAINQTFNGALLSLPTQWYPLPQQSLSIIWSFLEWLLLPRNAIRMRLLTTCKVKQFAMTYVPITITKTQLIGCVNPVSLRPMPVANVWWMEPVLSVTTPLTSESSTLQQENATLYLVTTILEWQLRPSATQTVWTVV